MNIADSRFCRVCGRQLAQSRVSYDVYAAAPDIYPQAPEMFQAAGFVEPGGDVFPQDDESYVQNAMNATFVPVTSKHESLLERLDRMERELEDKRREPLPENALSLPDELDRHEDELKEIAYTLDSLISDLLEAEAGEYAFPGFVRTDDAPVETRDEIVPPPKETEKQKIESDKKNGVLQEILIVATLIAAIFIVGLSFGLWGSYFFGL
jgi:hypothetical protein